MGKQHAKARAGRKTAETKKSPGFVKQSVPDVSSMGTLLAGSSSHDDGPVDSKIHFHILKYCSSGAVCSDAFDDGDVFMMLLECGMQPSPLYKLRQLVITYGAEAGEETPKNMDDIEEQFKTILVYNGKKNADVDDVGFTNKAMGFYVSGGAANMKELIMYLDELFFWRGSHADPEFDALRSVPELSIQMCEGLKLDIEKDKDEMKCKFEIKTVKDPAVSVFDLHPPTYPTRITIMTFEMISPAEAHVVVSANTKPFQAGFVQMKIKGVSVKKDASDNYGEYFRVLPNLELKDTEEIGSRLKQILGGAVLRSSPVIVRLKPCEHDAQNLKAVLKEIASGVNVGMDVDM